MVPALAVTIAQTLLTYAAVPGDATCTTLSTQSLPGFNAITKSQVVVWLIACCLYTDSTTSLPIAFARHLSISKRTSDVELPLTYSPRS